VSCRALYVEIEGNVRHYRVLALIIALTGCSVPSLGPAPVTPAEQGAARDGVQGAHRTSTACQSSPCIYYTDPARYKGQSRILEFPASAKGHARPVADIAGTSTLLRRPRGIAVDASGNLYVADDHTRSLAVYAAGANGDAAPIRTIKGPRTLLIGPQGVAVDSTGRIYVVNDNRNFGSSSVTVYAAGASGDVAPIQAIAGADTGLDAPEGIAVDDQQNIYVANSGSNSVAVYEAGATGQAQPIQDINGKDTGLADPGGLALDQDRNIYVSNASAGTVTVYASGATGDAVPIQAIGGNQTRMNGVGTIALDAARDIYVVSSPHVYRFSIYVFAAGSTGDVPPVRTIGGQHTKISRPGWMAIR
jgi:sugar lactone lactonase YvrE